MSPVDSIVLHDWREDRWAYSTSQFTLGFSVLLPDRSCVREPTRGQEAVGIAYAPQEQGYQETLHIRINLNWWVSGGGFNGAGREGRLHKCRTTGTEALSIFD
jgi:hypothetical protein